MLKRILYLPIIFALGACSTVTLPEVPVVSSGIMENFGLIDGDALAESIKRNREQSLESFSLSAEHFDFLKANPDIFTYDDVFFTINGNNGKKLKYIHLKDGWEYSSKTRLKKIVNVDQNIDLINLEDVMGFQHFIEIGTLKSYTLNEGVVFGWSPDKEFLIRYSFNRPWDGFSASHGPDLEILKRIGSDSKGLFESVWSKRIQMKRDKSKQYPKGSIFANLWLSKKCLLISYDKNYRYLIKEADTWSLSAKDFKPKVCG